MLNDVNPVEVGGTTDRLKGNLNAEDMNVRLLKERRVEVLTTQLIADFVLKG